MDRVRVLLIVLMLIGAWAVRPVAADIYTFKDAEGVIHLSNVPADPRYAVIIRESSETPGLNADAIRRSARAGAPDLYDALVAKIAREHDLDQALLQAVIAVESGYNPRAVSRKGAVGLMQLMPHTAKRYGATDLYDPAENVRAGAGYLRDLLRKFNDDLSLTLAAYNAGEDAVVRYGNRIPPYRETRSYVPKVMDLYRRYRPDAR
jgi:soluble lytic murein transglycosylase-like protein